MADSTLSEVYLVHHTHMDVGYTDLAGEVRNQHLGHLDQVLELGRGNADRAPDDRFYWTCESALLVRDYLEARPRRQRDALLQALRDGWIELQAFLTQPLTELASAQELVDNLAYACELARREGFTVSCGMIDDIGGYAGRLPSVMAQMQVPYLVAGVGAFQVHLPWADLPHLFYLRAADGGRVLVWNLGIDRTLTPQQMTQLAAVYGQAALYLIMPFQRALTGTAGRGVELDLTRPEATTSARARFAELEDRLRAEHYPYREVLLQYGGDNRGPDPELLPVLHALRQRADMPRVRLTTPVRFFRQMEATWGERIPVVDGVITDPWNLRANPAPGTLRRQREAQRLLETVAARSALFEAGGRPRHADQLAAAATNLQLGSDHTCGLSEWGWEKAFSRSTGCRDAAFDRYRESWQQKRQYAEQALHTLRELDRAQRQRLATDVRGDGPRVAVWNDTAVPSSGEGELYLGRGFAALRALHDAETGLPVPFLPLGGSRYLVDSPEVPPFGVRFLLPDVGPGAPAVQSTPDPCRLTGGGLELAIDRATGRIRSLRHVATGTEYLDHAAACGLGEVVCHDIQGAAYGALQAGMQTDCRLQERPARCAGVEAGPAGPLFSSSVTRWLVDGPRGPTWIERAVRVYHALPRVDLLVRVDKPENENKESLCVGLPWAGVDGAFAFDQNVGTVEPASDLAPGAMEDLFYCQSWAHLWAGAWGVTVAAPDAPLLQFGGMRFLQWEDRLPFSTASNHMLCHLYHNLLNTDCPIWQEILETFRFSLFFHAGSRPSIGECHRLAATARPLRADYLPVGTPGGGRRRLPELHTGPTALRLLAVRQRGRQVQMLVENSSRAELTATIEIGTRVREAVLTQLDGTPVASGGAAIAGRRVTVALGPSQLAILGLRR